MYYEQGCKNRESLAQQSTLQLVICLGGINRRLIGLAFWQNLGLSRLLSTVTILFEVRFQILEAASRMASLGFQKSYCKVIALMIRSYLSKLSSIGFAESNALLEEANRERIKRMLLRLQLIALAERVVKGEEGSDLAISCCISKWIIVMDLCSTSVVFHLIL
nr:phosphatidylinositol 4-kinase alpha 1 isoform X2 [Tanacetum cinerariifolium]